MQKNKYYWNLIESFLKEGALKDDIIRTFADEIRRKKYTGFNHVENPGRTADIGIGSNASFATTSELEVLTIFKNTDKYLIREKTFLSGEGEDCHHLVSSLAASLRTLPAHLCNMEESGC